MQNINEYIYNRMPFSSTSTYQSSRFQIDGLKLENDVIHVIHVKSILYMGECDYVIQIFCENAWYWTFAGCSMIRNSRF